MCCATVTAIASADRSDRFLPLQDLPIGPKGMRRLALPAEGRSDPHVRRAGDHPARAKTGRPLAAAKHSRLGACSSVDLARLKADPGAPQADLIYAPARARGARGRRRPRACCSSRSSTMCAAERSLFTPPANGAWSRSAIDLPDNSSIGIADASSTGQSGAASTVTSFLTPPSLWLADAGAGHGHGRS